MTKPPLSAKAPGYRAAGVERLHHQDAVADGQRTRAAGVADYHVCRTARADRCAVDDQRVRARGGAALVEDRVEFQRAAVGDEGAVAGDPGKGRAPVITSTSPATGLLCRSMMPELVNVDAPTPIKWPCNGPPSAIALFGFPSGRYCPVLSSLVAPVTAGSARRSVVGEAVVWAAAKVRYGHPERIAPAVRSGLGEVPQVERAIVEDVVVAARVELHETGDDAGVVDDGVVVGDQRTAGDSAVGQCADAAVIGQGRDAAR